MMQNMDVKNSLEMFQKPSEKNVKYAEIVRILSENSLLFAGTHSLNGFWGRAYLRRYIIYI